jgi:hypothetical protein
MVSLRISDVDQGLLLGLGLLLQIEVGHAHQLLDVRAADQRATEHLDLLVHIGLHGQARHQGLEDGLRVDVDAGLRLELVGQCERGGQPHQTQHPGSGQPQPAVLPDPPGLCQQFSDQQFHGFP